ncbi:glycosyltransferase family 87 protein [Corynebacterium pacaense]|uniref:glycosyltransferase family 87 protein n=1 Tax=Corynebacterium pacaense TaxID=1816684 RepID=UPI001178774E|nr:glycosyltransferase family 87 protein [Corynebacterium pacaense]
MSQVEQTTAPDGSDVGHQIIRVSTRDILTLLSVLGIAAGLIANKILIEKFDWRTDSTIYLLAGRALVKGEELYAAPFDIGDLSLPFIYPPIGAVLFAPFGYFEFFTEELAGNIIVALSSLMLLACLFLVSNSVLRGRDRLLAFTIAAIAWPIALFAEPVWLNADLGQINILIMTLVVMDLLPVRRRLPRGVLIGLAAAIKLSPLAMLLFFLVRKDFRGMFTALGSALVFTGIGALVSWRQTREFFTTTVFNLGADGDSGVSTVFQSNSSLQAMIYRWWPSQSAAEASAWPSVLWIVLSVVSIIAVAVLMHHLLARGLTAEAVMANAVLMLMISPISWSHHWVWLPLWALILLLRYMLHPGRPRILLYSGLGLSVLLLMLPPKWWFGRDGVDVFNLTPGEKFLISDYLWAAIALLIATAVSLRYFPRTRA